MAEQQFKKSLKGPASKRPNRQQNGNNVMLWITLGFLFLLLMSQSNTVNRITLPRQLSYSEFYTILQKNIETDQIQKLELIEGPERILRGTFKDGTDFKLNIPQEDQPLLDLIRKNVINFSVTPPQTFWSQFFFSFMPVLALIMFIWYISYRVARSATVSGPLENPKLR